MPRQYVQYIEDPTNENGGGHGKPLLVVIGVIIILSIWIALSCTQAPLRGTHPRFKTANYD